MTAVLSQVLRPLSTGSGGTSNTETKTKHKRYDEAFKKSAVEHWLLSGKSARQVATELGFNVQNRPKWKAKFKALPAGQVAGTLEALQAEHRRLQKELHRVAQQRPATSRFRLFFQDLQLERFEDSQQELN